MGPRLLCFAGGAAQTAFFVHLGLLATPFFGSGAFLWATVFACFLLSLALGYGLGDLIAAAAGRTQLERAAPRLAVAGALGAWLACYLLPLVCRAILDADPGWSLAPAAAIAATSLLPGALLAAIVPSELRASLEGSDGRAGARRAQRLLGLMTVGGIAGIALCAKPLLRADEVDVWIYAYATPALMAGLGAALLGAVGRGVTAALAATLVALSVALPSEVQTEQFAVALESSWEKGQGASVYYVRTAHTGLLTDEELRAHYEKLQREHEIEKPGIVLTLELLERLGAVTVTGDGLRSTLDLLLPQESRPYLMPIFGPVEAIRSDGKGMLYVTIRRERGVEGVRFSLPGEQPGQKTDFWFKDDFTIHLLREQEGGVPTWKLEFGPVVVERAGVFELNDTRRTPIRLPRVALWVDASLLGIVIQDFPDQVVVKAVAQGDIGDVKTVEVIVMPKGAKKPQPVK